MKMMKIRMNPGKLNDEMGGVRRKEDDQGIEEKRRKE
jgi:hypothetical protein